MDSAMNLCGCSTSQRNAAEERKARTVENVIQSQLLLHINIWHSSVIQFYRNTEIIFCILCQYSKCIEVGSTLVRNTSIRCYLDTNVQTERNWLQETTRLLTHAPQLGSGRFIMILSHHLVKFLACKTNRGPFIHFYCAIYMKKP